MSNYNDLIPAEMERIEKEHNSRWGFSMFLMSLPIFLFDIPLYLAWTKAATLVPPTMDGKMLFYGVGIAGIQIFMTVVTMGYGVVTIPASILSFVVLVWLL